MEKATIKDLSKATKLSLGTISKYLNGGKVKEKNIALIEEAIEQFDYKVDEYARGMKSKSTRTIGVIIPELFNHFYALLASKIEASLTEKQYLSIILENHSNMEKEKKLVNWLVSRRVSAIICVTSAKTKEDLKLYEDLDIPVLFVDKYIDGTSFDHILVDNKDISYKGVKYLLEHGHKNIAFIGAEKSSYTALQRYLGYKAALEEFNVEVNEKNVFFLDEEPTTAYKVVNSILMKKGCSAIFSSNYTTTLGTIFSTNELKLAVPEDISILGFDNIYLTELYKTSLSIINQPIGLIAQMSVKRLFERIEKQDIKPKTMYINAELIIGKSVKDLR